MFAASRRLTHSNPGRAGRHGAEKEGGSAQLPAAQRELKGSYFSYGYTIIVVNRHDR
jgi:hypothetical protein